MFGYGNLRLLRSSVQHWLSLKEDAQLGMLKQLQNQLHAAHSLKVGPSNSISVTLEAFRDYLQMEDVYQLRAGFNGYDVTEKITLPIRVLPLHESRNPGEALAAKFARMFAEVLAKEIESQVYPIMLARRLRD